VRREQRKGEEQEPEPGAGRDARKAIALGREVARRSADGHSDGCKRYEAGDEPCARRGPQQRDENGGGDDDGQRDCLEGGERGEDGAAFAEHDAVGAERGKGRDAAGPGNRGDEHPELVERTEGTCGRGSDIGHFTSLGGWSRERKIIRAGGPRADAPYAPTQPRGKHWARQVLGRRVSLSPRSRAA